MADRPTPATTIVAGAPGSGKTQFLIAEALRLCRENPAADVLFLAATPDTAASMRRRAQTAEPEQAPLWARLRIATPAEVAASLLAEPEAQTATGCTGRVLLPFEEDLMREDILVCGIKPKRLREMLKFFAHSWADLADRDPAWLVTSEERTIMGLIDDYRAMTGGVVPAALSNEALKALEAAPELIGRWGADYVLADDFTLLNRASQHLARALARTGLIAAGQDGLEGEAFDPYPCPTGLAELREACPEATMEVLKAPGRCPAARHALDLEGTIAPDLLSLNEIDPVPPVRGADAPTCIEAATPDEEAQALAAAAASWRGDEAHLPGAIAVPNRQRMHAIADALRQADVPCETALDAGVIASRSADDRGSALGRAVSLLFICADPDDHVAWRTWCGFGVHLGNSAGVKALREAHGSGRIGNWIAGMAEGEEGRAASLALASIREKAAIAAQLARESAALAGEELIALVVQRACPDAGEAARTAAQLAALCRPLPAATRPAAPDGIRAAGSGEGAAALAGRLRSRLQFPAFEEPGSVAVGTYGRIGGTETAVVAAAGLVAGLLPRAEVYDPAAAMPERRARLWRQGAPTVAATACRAKEELIVSFFEQAPLELAERYAMKIRRITMRDGQRTARVRPSDYLATLLS